MVWGRERCVVFEVMYEKGVVYVLEIGLMVSVFLRGNDRTDTFSCPS